MTCFACAFRRMPTAPSISVLVISSPPLFKSPLIRRGRPAFLRASAARYPCGDDGGAPSLARYGISHPPRFIWRESSLVTVSIFGSAIKRYLQALLSGSARTLGERARTPYAGGRSEEHPSELPSL